MQLTALQPKVWWQNYYFKAFVMVLEFLSFSLFPLLYTTKDIFFFTVILTFSKCPSIKWRMTP